MKHLSICDYGTFLGIDGRCLIVKQKDEVRRYPLNRLSTISIAKRGVSFSSDLVEGLCNRGIKLFFLDFRGVAYASIMGQSQHGVVATRLAQQNFYKSKDLILPKKIITGKIKNQRAVLNYLNKYHGHDILSSASKELLFEYR